MMKWSYSLEWVYSCFCLYPFLDAVFGADIKQICAKEKTKVPTFVVRSIDAIEQRGESFEYIKKYPGLE